MLERLAVEDARGVEDVQSRVFAFEDIVRLSPAEMRRLLGAVGYESWGAALRGAPDALVDRVLADLPELPREFVREAAQTPQPRDKIVAARSAVLDALAGLSAKGQLNMGKDTPGGGLI
jgi:flagellar motor switch protein FliG